MTYYLNLFLLFGVPVAGGVLSQRFWQAALIGAALGAYVAFAAYGVEALNGSAHSLVSTAVCGAGLTCLVHGVSRFFRKDFAGGRPRTHTVRTLKSGRFWLLCGGVLVVLLMHWGLTGRMPQSGDELAALRTGSNG